MLRKSLRWLWWHPKLSFCLVLAACFGVLNLVAYNHAYSMTHFQQGGSKTTRPEALSFAEKCQVALLGVNIPKPCNHTDPSSQGLTFETCRFQGMDGVGLEAWHVPRPNAKGMVLLLHGYASCKANLLPEAKAFYDQGYAPVLLDLRGSGGSDGNVTTIGFSEADDVAAVVQSLQRSHPDQPLVLYGQSMGSVAILRAIAKNGVQPQAVVIECPFDRMLSTVENRFSAMGLPPFPCARLLVFWGGFQHGFNGFSHNPVEYASAVHCPVLLMHGAKDSRVTTEQAQAVLANLAGEKRFELFPDVGHESYLAAKPELWNRTVSNFLREHIR
jgi:alpha-beta hydrolase superfamily lysophospholipase